MATAASLDKTHDLGSDWYLNLWSDGSATVRNTEKGQRINLPKDSVDLLRRIFRDANEQVRA